MTNTHQAQYELAMILGTVGAALLMVGVGHLLRMHPSIIKIMGGIVLVLGIFITWMPWWATAGVALVLASLILVAIKGEYGMIVAASHYRGVPTHDDDDCGYD